MVGSRQVTLSVYKQLDHVPYDVLSVFGRISVKDDAMEVIGKDTRNGVLAVSTFSYEENIGGDTWCGRRVLRVYRGVKIGTMDGDNPRRQWIHVSDAPRFEIKKYYDLPLIILAGLR